MNLCDASSPGLPRACSPPRRSPAAVAGGDGTPMLTWFAMPDNGGAATRATECAEASGGAYRVQVETLPNNATSAARAARPPTRGQGLLDRPDEHRTRRLVAEFANAGFLRALHRRRAGAAHRRGARGAAEDRHVEGHPRRRAVLGQHAAALVPQVGCRRGRASTPSSPDFTWDEMIKAAVAQGKRVAVQGARYEGYMVLDQRAGRSAAVARSSKIPRQAATPPRASRLAGRRRRPPRSSAGWPARPRRPPTCRRPRRSRPAPPSRATTACSWSTGPTSTAAARSAVEEGTLSQAVVDDIGWARYPRVFADKPSAPPLGGINLAIGAYTEHPDQARGAGRVHQRRCRSHPVHARRRRTRRPERGLRRPRVRETFPMADLIRESIDEARAAAAHAVLRRRRRRRCSSTWHPPAVGQPRDAGRAQTDLHGRCPAAEGDCCDARSTTPRSRTTVERSRPEPRRGQRPAPGTNAGSAVADAVGAGVHRDDRS